MRKIVGPFTQLLPLHNLPMKGPIDDESLHILLDGAIVHSEGTIEAVGNFEDLRNQFPDAMIEELKGDNVGLPGLIDCHTHICFGGTRDRDYAARNNGKTYQEIAAAGGGIWDTVTQTRKASEDELADVTSRRLQTLLHRGITTAEVKSGYGLSIQEELKMLRAIRKADDSSLIDVISTCLAAHIIPREYADESSYLEYLLAGLVPIVAKEKLASRFDIFVEENAFTPSNSANYLEQIKANGFDVTVHGDQFSTGGSSVAIQVGAVSVDHLEASGNAEIEALAKSSTIPVVLPGASLGLGIPFAPARKLIDAGCGVAIASDWNPGSAPNGNLLTQASLIGAYEKLSAAEVFAGITYRSAKALNLSDRGILKKGCIADFISFQTDDYREILYHQGELQATGIWKKGVAI